MAEWIVRIPGSAEIRADMFDLQKLVSDRVVKADTPVENAESGTRYVAQQIPGIFSPRTMPWLSSCRSCCDISGWIAFTWEVSGLDS